MLVELNVQNLRSFNSMQTFSMVASTSNKEGLPINTMSLNKFGIDNILKSAVLFGANASGKSSFMRAISLFQKIMLESLLTTHSHILDEVIPFVLKEDCYDIPTELEVSFVQAGVLYRYGLSFANGIVSEEWLYRNINVRDSLLFHREEQTVTYNKTSFTEIKNFVKKDSHGHHILTKTKNNVPLVSVLSQFDGQICSQVIDWFSNIRVMSGLDDMAVTGYTINKFETDPLFHQWALDILKNFHIADVSVQSHQDIESNILPINNKINKRLIISKIMANGDYVQLPFAMESAGTKKVINCLGPIYDVIKYNRILIIDEFANKFHTLLSKYIIDIIHKNNKENSQLIVSTHDTNLLTKDVFRRDQIWFVEKNADHASEIFSLAEYKERHTRKNDGYTKDYLAGKYGAIPLFEHGDLSQGVFSDE